MGRGRWAEPLMALVPIALAVFTLVVLVEPGVQPAIVNLRLALAIDAVATLAAVAVAILGWVRYREGGDEAALWRASALLVLGTINALVATVTILGVETGFGLSVDDPGQLPLRAAVEELPPSGLPPVKQCSQTISSCGFSRSYREIRRWG